MNILIADDQAVVRKGLRQILLEELHVRSISEACDGTEALALLHADNWDMLVLDITMPRQSGIDVLRELQHVGPHLPVVMLSMHINPSIVKRCLDMGAAGFVAKEAAPEELVRAMRAVLAGRTYLCKAIAALMATAGRPASAEVPSP